MSRVVLVLGHCGYVKMILQALAAEEMKCIELDPEDIVESKPLTSGMFISAFAKPKYDRRVESWQGSGKRRKPPIPRRLK